jgi:hypothetical protein
MTVSSSWPIQTYKGRILVLLQAGADKEWTQEFNTHMSHMSNNPLPTKRCPNAVCIWIQSCQPQGLFEFIYPWLLIWEPQKISVVHVGENQTFSSFVRGISLYLRFFICVHITTRWHGKNSGRGSPNPPVLHKTLPTKSPVFPIGIFQQRNPLGHRGIAVFSFGGGATFAFLRLLPLPLN